MRRLGRLVVVGVQETAAGRLKFRVDVRGGNETIVADSDESGGQNVQEESAHEFHGINSGGFAVFGAKADVVAVKADQPLIRQTDPVGVSA